MTHFTGKILRPRTGIYFTSCVPLAVANLTTQRDRTGRGGRCPVRYGAQHVLGRDSRRWAYVRGRSHAASDVARATTVDMEAEGASRLHGSATDSATHIQAFCRRHLHPTAILAGSINA